MHTDSVTLAGPFHRVRLYMTERTGATSTRGYRWTDAQLVGSLKVIVQGEVCGIPLAYIKVYENFDDEETIFEYELPLNFMHDCELSDKFYAIKSGFNDQYFGFHMAKAEDKTGLI